MIRAPLAPSGWPSAIAPPFTFTLARSAPVSRCQASTTLENASFTSNRSMSASVRPDRRSTFSVAGMTAVSIINGSSPTTAKLCSRASGRSPSCSARSPDMISSAAAPSLIGLLLPAVTDQSICGNRFDITSLANAGRSPASTSAVVPGRTDSSRSTSPFARGHRHDLAAEAALGPRLRGPLVRGGREVVQLGPRQPPFGRDQLGADALWHQALGVALRDAGPERVGAGQHGRPHRHPAHRLHAARDHDVVGAGDDALRGEVHGLLLLLPHCRSTVVAGTLSGSPALSAAHRVVL